MKIASALEFHIQFGVQKAGDLFRFPAWQSGEDLVVVGLPVLQTDILSLIILCKKHF